MEQPKDGLEARKDGRPQYYDIPRGVKVQCALCVRDGNTIAFGHGEAVMCDPANSPFEDGGVYTIAVQRLPDNAVIYDPETNRCRNKAGTETWAGDIVQ